MAEIATQSDVSTDLVFRLFGNKRGVLKEVMDYVIGGDDADIPFLDREGPQTVRHSTDQREQLRRFSVGTTRSCAALAPTMLCCRIRPPSSPKSPRYGMI